jgi:Cu/Ag efflux protein CusF
MRAHFIGGIGAGLLSLAVAANAQSARSSTGDQSPQNPSSQSSATTPSSESSAKTPSTQSSGTLPSSDSSGTSVSNRPGATHMPASQSDSATRDLSTQQPLAQTAPSAASKNEVSGVVKKVDRSNHSVQISSSGGGEQELKLSPSATITRDGNQMSLDQLKEGDQVRASFDPSLNEALSIQVTPESKTKPAR